MCSPDSGRRCKRWRPCAVGSRVRQSVSTIPPSSRRLSMPKTRKQDKRWRNDCDRVRKENTGERRFGNRLRPSRIRIAVARETGGGESESKYIFGKSRFSSGQSRFPAKKLKGIEGQGAGRRRGRGDSGASKKKNGAAGAAGLALPVYGINFASPSPPSLTRAAPSEAAPTKETLL